jgi:hypothetical protein
MSIGRLATFSSNATALSSGVDQWNCSGATPHQRPQDGTRIADTLHAGGELVVWLGLGELGSLLAVEDVGEVGEVDVGSGEVGSGEVVGEVGGEVGGEVVGDGGGELFPPPDGVRRAMTTCSSGRPCGAWREANCAIPRRTGAITAIVAVRRCWNADTTLNVTVRRADVTRVVSSQRSMRGAVW